MLSKEKKQKMMDEQGGSKLMTSNVKVLAKDLINMELTIEDYDRIDSDDDHYYVVTAVEIPGSYFFSGSALNKLIDSAEEDNEDIRGEKIMILPEVRTKSGKNFTPVKLL